MWRVVATQEEVSPFIDAYFVNPSYRQVRRLSSELLGLALARTPKSWHHPARGSASRAGPCAAPPKVLRLVPCRPPTL